MAVSPLCRQFAAILKAQPQVINGVCTASSLRSNIHPTILGKKSKSFLTLTQAFTFENVGRDGRALCLGVIVILTNEINPFISRLRKHGIKVSAINNHWLFTKPAIWYIHFEKVDRPLNFARGVRDALDVLTTKPVNPMVLKK